MQVILFKDITCILGVLLMYMYLSPPFCLSYQPHPQEIKKAQEDYRAEMTQQEHVVLNPNRLGSDHNHHGYCTGAFANIVLFVCVILFAGLVKFLVQSVP